MLKFSSAFFFLFFTNGFLKRSAAQGNWITKALLKICQRAYNESQNVFQMQSKSV